MTTAADAPGLLVAGAVAGGVAGVVAGGVAEVVTGGVAGEVAGGVAGVVSGAVVWGTGIDLAPQAAVIKTPLTIITASAAR